MISVRKLTSYRVRVQNRWQLQLAVKWFQRFWVMSWTNCTIKLNDFYFIIYRLCNSTTLIIEHFQKKEKEKVFRFYPELSYVEAWNIMSPLHTSRWLYSRITYILRQQHDNEAWRLLNGQRRTFMTPLFCFGSRRTSSNVTWTSLVDNLFVYYSEGLLGNKIVRWNNVFQRIKMINIVYNFHLFRERWPKNCM